MKGKCWEEPLPHPPDLMLFLLEGVSAEGPAATGMAARCHPPLMLEVKAVQKEKKELGREQEDTPPPAPGVGELGEGPGWWDGC